jgi:hypothetical protein
MYVLCMYTSGGIRYQALKQKTAPAGSLINKGLQGKQGTMWLIDQFYYCFSDVLQGRQEAGERSRTVLVPRIRSRERAAGQRPLDPAWNG